MSKILAVDLCNTIYDSNTTQDFFNFVFENDDYYKSLKRKNKSVSFKVVNKLSNKIFKYDMSRALITKILSDKTKEEIDLLVLDFIDNFLSEKKIEKVHSIIEDYKLKGYKVVIISASYDFIARAVVKKLGLDSCIASKAEIVNERYTGRVERDIFYKKFDVFKDNFKLYSELIMITDNETDYDFVKNTKKSYIVINNSNRAFWNQRREEKFIFLEE